MKISKLRLKMVGSCLGLIAVVSIFQDKLGIKIDGATMLILGIAATLFIIDDIDSLKKIKFGDMEVELEVTKGIDKLESMVIVEEVTQENTHNDTISESEKYKIGLKWSAYYDEYRIFIAHQGQT